MLNQSRTVTVKTYPISVDPKADTFVAKMHQSRKILAVNGGYAGYEFLVEEPSGDYQKDFTFHLVRDKAATSLPTRSVYLGTILVVEDTDSDRPVGVPRHVYGLREGDAMGGAL